MARRASNEKGLKVGEWVHHFTARVAEATTAHPITTTVAGIATTVVSVMQSAQTVMGTLIAFATSMGGLLVVVLQARRAWRNRNKD